MYELLKLFFDICLFKKGPQDIPSSNWLFRALILIYAFVNYLVLTLSGDPFNAFLQVLVEIMLVLGMGWLILLVANKIPRFQQTVSALLGTDTVISFFALPIMATLIGQGSELAFIFIVLLMIWHWIVSGYIFSHALEQPLSFSLAIAFMYILTSYQVMGMLFPQIILTE